MNADRMPFIILVDRMFSVSKAEILQRESEKDLAAGR
jgi:hypothetical protein